MLEIVQQDKLLAAIEILGTENIDEDEVDNRIAKLVNDAITVTRLVVWPPEAFGIVLISHNWDVELPKTFFARNAADELVEFPFDCEPIFVESVKIAQHVYHNGPAELFKNIALQGAMVSAVNAVLNSEAELAGAKLGGPALIGIPAEIYPLPKKSFWQKLFSK